MVGEEVGLRDTEFKVENVEELAFYPADVALAEDPRAKCPVHVLERGVVQTYLVGEDKCAEEDALVCPLLEGDLDVWLGAVDVDEGDEEGGDLDLCLVDDVCDELEELRVFRVAGD
ncbi:hypothetical protein NUW54_g14596 [Trametes sanguinea]|uniref:Uncharacterized protein n=1 Tax=Trametes sanguinea TaxID=158606 RepID=A0ACC1MCC7_9APHY|nr:hypothetical protein NUW54_g14596 [Trametes sanguinea]